MTKDLSLINKFFKKCTFNDECDECGNPQRKQSWARMAGLYEYPDEVEYYVCEDCAKIKAKELELKGEW